MAKPFILWQEIVLYTDFFDSEDSSDDDDDDDDDDDGDGYGDNLIFALTFNASIGA